MSTDAAFRAFEQAIARYEAPRQIGAALYALTQDVIGVGLLTLTAINMEAGHVRRVYSSNEDAYPLLGTKPLVEDEWFEDMRTARRITAINRSEDMEGQFTDLPLIRSLGYSASLSVPAMAGNQLLGTINALDVEGRYGPEAVDAAQALIVPAVTCFLLLRQHFDA